MLGRILNIGCALILASGALAAQELQITPANRTIYVTAEDEVTLEPAIAISILAIRHSVPTSRRR